MKSLSTIGVGRAAVWSVWLTVLLGMGACDDGGSSDAAPCDPGAVCQCTKKSDCAATEDCVNNVCAPSGQATQNTANGVTNTASNTASTTGDASSTTGTGSGGGAGADTTGSAGAAGDNGSGGTGGNSAEPAVVLVLDRSTSAKEDFDDGASRWEAIVAALTEEDGPVEENAATLALGVLDYTGFQGGGTCPEFGDGVDPELDNYEAVNEYVSSISLPEEDKSETPTREAIERGVSMLSGAAGPKALILITDSLTDDTCGTFDTQACVSQAYYAAQQAYTGGVRTYILGITDLDDNFLRGVANAGTGQNVGEAALLSGSCGPENEQPEINVPGGDAPFWEANTTDVISSSLDEIFQAIRNN